MAKPQTVAELLTKAIDISGKTQKEIAAEVGWPKPNILSMMKQGLTKVPIDKVPALAKACGIDESMLLQVAMIEYMPATWAVIQRNCGVILTDEEKRIIDEHRNKVSV